MGRRSCADGYRAFLVVTDLARVAFYTAGPAVAGVGAQVYLTPVRYNIVAVVIVSLALGNHTFPAGTQGSFGIREECLAFRPAGAAVVHVRIQVNTGVTTQARPAFCARRPAPGTYADFLAPARTTADATVFLIGEEVHAGIAAERLAAGTGYIGNQRYGSTCTHNRCRSARQDAPTVLACLSGRAGVTAGSAVPVIGPEIPAYATAGGLARGA